MSHNQETVARGTEFRNLGVLVRCSLSFNVSNNQRQLLGGQNLGFSRIGKERFGVFDKITIVCG